MLGHILDGGAVILGDITVGTHIIEKGFHRRPGQMDAVAGLHITALGVAGGGILEHLGAVEEFPPLFLAHLDQRFVVLVHLRLGQVLVGVRLPQRRDGVDDDVHAGVGFDDALDAFLVVFHEILRRVAGAQVIGAEGQNDPPGLHQRHRLGHGDIIGIPLQLHAGIGGQRARAHAHRTDGVVIAAVVEHAVHAGRVAVPQEKRLVHVVLPGVLALLQDGGGILGLVDGVLILVVAALGHQRVAVRSGVRPAVRAGGVQPADEHKGDRHAYQQHQAAHPHDQIHFAAGIQRLFIRFFFRSACHCSSFRTHSSTFGTYGFYFTLFWSGAPVFSQFLHILARKNMSPARCRGHTLQILCSFGSRCARCSAGSSAR